MPVIQPKSEQSSAVANGQGPVKSSLAVQVRVKTLESLEQAKVIQSHEKEAFDNYLISTKSSVGDLLPIMAELRKVAEDRKIETLQSWGRSIAQAQKKRYSFIPFGSRLLNPTGFYEKYSEIYDWCRELKVGVLYAEDADCLGLGTLNPAASEILGDKIVEYLNEKEGVRPFVSKLLIDLESWDVVCKKHFSL